MNPELLTDLGKIAGIGGICVGALVLIFRSVIHENFLSKMTQEQSYKITNKIITFSGVLVLLGVSSWVYLKASGNDVDKSRVVIKGTVKDVDNNNLQNIHVNLKSGGQPLGSATTDSDGNFSLSHSGHGKLDALIEITGQGYIVYTKNLEINYSEATIQIGEVKLKSDDPNKNKPIVNVPSQASPNSGANLQQGLIATSGSAGNASITINTLEYGTLLSSLGAAANATLNIAGVSYTLTNSDLIIPFSQPGMVDYQITGYTYNEMGTMCNNNSVGQIELAAGTRYYLFENLNNSSTTDCNWYLFNEYQFSQQKSVLQQRIVQMFQ